MGFINYVAIWGGQTGKNVRCFHSSREFSTDHKLISARLQFLALSHHSMSCCHVPLTWKSAVSASFKYFWTQNTELPHHKFPLHLLILVVNKFHHHHGFLDRRFGVSLSYIAWVKSEFENLLIPQIIIQYSENNFFFPHMIVCLNNKIYVRISQYNILPSHDSVS